MRIFRSIVAPPATFVAMRDPKMTCCSPVRTQVICDQLIGEKAVFLQKLAHQFECRLLVPPGLDQHIKNFALGIQGTPEVDQATIDLEIDFVEISVRRRPVSSNQQGRTKSREVGRIAQGLQQALW